MKKNSKFWKIVYWFRAGLPTLQGVRGGSSGVSPRPAPNQHSESIHCFYFFTKKWKKNSKFWKIVYWFRAGLPILLDSWRGLDMRPQTSQHWHAESIHLWIFFSEKLFLNFKKNLKIKISKFWQIIDWFRAGLQRGGLIPYPLVSPPSPSTETTCQSQFIFQK